MGVVVVMRLVTTRVMVIEMNAVGGENLTLIMIEKREFRIRRTRKPVCLDKLSNFLCFRNNFRPFRMDT